MAIKNVNTINELRSKIVRNKFPIAIYHPTGDKWQSKALFLAIFDLSLSIVKSVFDCCLPSVNTGQHKIQTVTRTAVNLADIFVQKMSSAYYICCIYSNAFQTNFITEANNINPDQTAPKDYSICSSLFWPHYVFASEISKIQYRQLNLVSSADNLCKQFRPRSGSTKCLFDTLMDQVFLKESFGNIIFCKKSAGDNKNMKKV